MDSDRRRSILMKLAGSSPDGVIKLPPQSTGGAGDPREYAARQLQPSIGWNGTTGMVSGNARVPGTGTDANLTYQPGTGTGPRLTLSQSVIRNTSAKDPSLQASVTFQKGSPAGPVPSLQANVPVGPLNLSGQLNPLDRTGNVMGQLNMPGGVGVMGGAYGLGTPNPSAGAGVSFSRNTNRTNPGPFQQMSGSVNYFKPINQAGPGYASVGFNSSF